MKLELVDSLSLPGDPRKANDDAFAFRENAAVVLDGATGLGERLLPGPSDAAWLSRFGANRLMAYMADGATPLEAVTAALFDAQTSFEQLRRREPADRYETPSPRSCSWARTKMRSISSGMAIARPLSDATAGRRRSSARRSKSAPAKVRG